MKNRAMFVLVLTLFVTFISSAQLSAEEKEVVELEEIVVSATRTVIPVRELGVSATVITADEIERRQARDVLELLRDVAGIQVVQSGSRGGNTALYLRGGEDNFTLVLIDGIQVNEGGGFFDFATLTTDDIERIEIIRGPQSALYGSDAIGGVIQIITRKGEGRPSVNVSTAHGGHSKSGSYIGEQRLSFAGGNEWLGYSFAYGRVDDQGILDVNDDFWNNTFSGRVDLCPKEIWDITFTVRYEDARLEFPTENGGDRPDSVFPGLDPDQHQEDHDLAVGVGTRFDVLPWWENVMHVGYHWQEREFDDPPNSESAFDASPGSFSLTEEARFAFDYHINLRFPQEEGVRSTLTLGYEYERETFDLDSVYTSRYGSLPAAVFTSIAQADESRTNHAFYLQEQLTLLDRLHLTGGFRVDDNSEFGTEVSPRGSVAFEIKETGTKLRGAIGIGIKEPTFVENFGGFGTIGNPDLDPEKSFSWEVGLDQRLWDGKVQLGLTYFRNKYEDLIAYVPTPFPPPPLLPPNYFNVQEAENWGVEFTAKVNPGYGLTLGVNYTYLETEVTDAGGLVNLFFAEGEELLRRPNHKVSFFVDWLWRGLNVHLNGTYVGARDDSLFLVTPGPFYTFTNLRLENDDYFVLDLAASYSFDIDLFSLKGIKVFVKGENIFDESYEEALGYSSPGFSAMGGLEFAF